MNRHDKAISDLGARLAVLLVLKFALVAAGRYPVPIPGAWSDI